MVLETRIIDNMAKGFEANLTLANVGMAIDAGAKLSLGIVEMKGEDLLEADERIDFTDGSIPAFGRADVVACGEEMGGVEAKAKAFWIFDKIGRAHV